VYVFTAVVSIWAYVWLIIILMLHTPNVVDIWEAVITFVSFPILVYTAFLIDTNKFDRCCRGARISVASAQMRLSRYGSAKFVLDKIKIRRGRVSPELLQPREAVSLLRVLRPDTSRLTEKEIVEIGEPLPGGGLQEGGGESPGRLEARGGDMTVGGGRGEWYVDGDKMTRGAASGLGGSLKSRGRPRAHWPRRSASPPADAPG
jgi:hypothetical protein